MYVSFQFFQEQLDKNKQSLLDSLVLDLKKMISMMLENQSFVILCRKKMKKSDRKVCGFEKMHYLCNRNQERKQRKKNLMVR